MDIDHVDIIGQDEPILDWANRLLDALEIPHKHDLLEDILIFEGEKKYATLYGALEACFAYIEALKIKR